jgi:hypothetical protein
LLVGATGEAKCNEGENECVDFKHM